MKLYYCSWCGCVFAFNEDEIHRHELTKVEDRQCSSCGDGPNTMRPLELGEVNKVS